MSTCKPCNFTAKRSLRLYEYGGVVSEQFIGMDISDVKLHAFLNHFNTEALNETAPKAAELVREIKNKVERSLATDSITAADDRILFSLATLMRKYPEALDTVGEKDQWVVVYEFLRRFYDSLKGVNRLDDLVRVVNLQMGITFAVDQVTAVEAMELMGYDMDETWEAVLPRFVVNAILYNADALTPFNDSIKEFQANQLFNELYAAITAA